MAEKTGPTWWEASLVRALGPPLSKRILARGHLGMGLNSVGTQRVEALGHMTTR
jgi:hypothetical protein